MEQLSVTGGPFLARLAMVNVFLVLFNILPAFPMDGGRVLRALLATRMEYARATNIAARLGQFMAFGFGFLGLFTNPMLLFIALFVWIGAEQEAGAAQVKSALGGIPMRQVMITDFRTLAPEDTLARAVDHILAGFQQDFPVVEPDGRLVGVLTRADLIRALADRGQSARVDGVMQRDFHTADPFDMAENVLARLQECNCHALPVVRDGRLVGLLTAENLGEFLMIQAALRGERPAAKVA